MKEYKHESILKRIEEIKKRMRKQRGKPVDLEKELERLDWINK